MNDDKQFGLTKTLRGVITIALGCILFLYVLNIGGQWLNGFFILIALALISYGSIESGLMQKIMSMIEKK